jgi:dTDP-4-amino-4,6-dideoxygalactose transaminase
VLTHLYGEVGDVEAIADLCRSRRITLVEDCAQALGAEVGDRRVGTFGTAAAISFYPTKNLGAAGDGGAVLTSDDDVADRVRSLRQYGWTGKYEIARPHGTNSRLDELQAAILRVGLRRVDDLTERRRAIVRRYDEALSSTAASMVSGRTRAHVAHLAVLLSGDRERIRGALDAEGIGSDIHYPIPDHRQPGLPAPARKTDLRVTERAANEVLTIPCFPEMTPPEIEAVCDILKSFAA